MTPLVELKDVCVIFDERPILNKVSFKLERGKITTIIGPNGAGKSTLIKAILGLISPDSGRITKDRALTVGYVPQKNHLNEAIPLTVDRFLRLAGKFTCDERNNALKLMQVTHLKKNNMHKLSGGETQRVLLARAMLRKPDLLVLDEPAQGVDINGQQELYHLITELRDTFNCAVMMVSHDLHLVMAKTDQVICLQHHICCQGTPETIITDEEFNTKFGLAPNNELGFYHHKHSQHHHSLSGFDIIKDEENTSSVNDGKRS